MYCQLTCNVILGALILFIIVTELGRKIPFPLRNAISHIELNSETMRRGLLNSEVF